MNTKTFNGERIGGAVGSILAPLNCIVTLKQGSYDGEKRQGSHNRKKIVGSAKSEEESAVGG
jgi:hypothetical protein